MAFLRELPARPRGASTAPRYPRRGLIGALALAASAVACGPTVIGGTVTSTDPKSTRVDLNQGGAPTDPGWGGDFGGGIAEPWGGAGGVGGGATGGAGGAGGEETGGAGGSFGGDVAEGWGGAGGQGGQGGGQ